MSLLKLADLLYKLLSYAIEAYKKMKADKTREKIDAAFEKQDQRDIEKELGGSSGPVNPNDYPGVFTRKRKKGSESLDD